MKCNIPSGNCISCFQAMYLKKLCFNLSNVCYTSAEKWSLVYVPPTATSHLLIQVTATLHLQYQGLTELIKPVLLNCSLLRNSGHDPRKAEDQPDRLSCILMYRSLFKQDPQKLNLKAVMNDFYQTSPTRSHLSVFKKLLSINKTSFLLKKKKGGGALKSFRKRKVTVLRVAARMKKRVKLTDSCPLNTILKLRSLPQSCKPSPGSWGQSKEQICILASAKGTCDKKNNLYCKVSDNSAQWCTHNLPTSNCPHASLDITADALPNLTQCVSRAKTHQVDFQPPETLPVPQTRVS